MFFLNMKTKASSISGPWPIAGTYSNLHGPFQSCTQLVGGIPTPSEKWWSSSVGMMTFPTEWKVIIQMFQTTNQPNIPYGKLLHSTSGSCLTLFFWAWPNMLGKKQELPSGKRLHNYGKSPFLMGKSTISMAIFNSYVTNYQSCCCCETKFSVFFVPYLRGKSHSFSDTPIYIYQHVAGWLQYNVPHFIAFYRFSHPGHSEYIYICICTPWPIPIFYPQKIIQSQQRPRDIWVRVSFEGLGLNCLTWLWVLKMFFPWGKNLLQKDGFSTSVKKPFCFARRVGMAQPLMDP